MRQKPTRRRFLYASPLALSSFTLCARAEPAFEGSASTHAPEPFQLFSADMLAEKMHALEAAPGNNNLLASSALPLTVVMTTEEKKRAAEFEWHEGRDHIVQILAGQTRYEVGGTPDRPRNTRAGEWLAPASAGATTMTLHVGDMLIIPRGTPHKRSTDASVTFLLISTTGRLPAA